jgi:hypothetical protein
VNNPIVLNATTTTKQDCSATDLRFDSVSKGYKYAFETLGTDVKITFELLDGQNWRCCLFKGSPASERK